MITAPTRHRATGRLATTANGWFGLSVERGGRRVPVTMEQRRA